MDIHRLQQTIEALVIPGRGILAADESIGTIGKRFKQIQLENNETNRAAYRSLLATTENLGEYISGVILFEETLQHNTASGEAIPAAFAANSIVPGIKVDKGLTSFASSPEEQITQGLDGLDDRLTHYAELGCRFAKWRNVYRISGIHPSAQAVHANAEMLARYAAICQRNSIVPIVEPEVLMEGDHTIERCAEVSTAVFQAVFNALYQHRVILELMLLKPNMIVAGKDCATQPNATTIAEHTVRILKRTVPAAVPSINFLSGGQTPTEATVNLNAINQIGSLPWHVSFSYGRALQETCLQVWQGKSANSLAAQQELLKRAKLNSLASQANYPGE